jgi:hypothetical protein
MATCSTFKCSEDLITTESLESDTKCVAISPDHCAKCETVQNVRSRTNAGKFNKDPISVVFGKTDATPAQISKFWDELATCHIYKPAGASSSSSSAYEIFPLDFMNLGNDLGRILRRLKRSDKSARTFFESLNEVADTAKMSFADKDAHARTIRDILQKRNCSSQMAHHFRELPNEIGHYMSDVNDLNTGQFKKLVEYLNGRPQICLEGAMEVSLRASNIRTLRKNPNPKKRIASKTRRKSAR